MDGVITNTMPDHYKAWKTVFSELGIKITRQEIYEREGQPGLDSIVELLDKFKIKHTTDDIKLILAKKESIFKKITKVRFIPGARKFLNTLLKNEIQCALVTGTTREEVKRILPEHIYEQFKVIITGSDVKQGKPHPEPYQKCINLLNIPKEKVVVIENAPYGISSAKAAGLKCFAIETSLSENYLKDADRIFKSYKELRSVFPKLK